MDPRTTTALPAPRTPEENAMRLARDRAVKGTGTSGNHRGDDPDRVRPAGVRSFVRKDGDAR